jgi:hypothetical protein
VKEIMIFEMKEVLHMSAIGVDLDYAAKGKQISCNKSF